MSRTEPRGAGFIPVSPPTLADVAERAGVSRQTVSNAVNNPDLLRPNTLERVREAIEEMGYSPNRAARNLRTRSSQLIGLRVLPAQEGTANAMMDRFVHTLVDTSAEAGYHVLLFAADNDDPVGGYDHLLRSTAVDAFVVTDTYLGNPAGRLADRAARALRRLRSSLGPAAGHASVGRRRRRSRHPPGHRAPPREGSHQDRLDRLAQGLTHRRGPSRGLAGRDARCRPRHHGSRLAGGGHRPERRRGRRRTPRRIRSDGVRLRLRHAGDGRAPHAVDPPARARVATSRSSASTTPRSRRCSRWA